LKAVCQGADRPPALPSGRLAANQIRQSFLSLSIVIPWPARPVWTSETRGAPILPIVNIEVNEKMEFACAPSVRSAGAQRPSGVGCCRIVGPQISSHTPVGASRAPAPAGVLRRSVKRPNLTSVDRLLWTWLCEVWSDWRSSLIIVKPEHGQMGRTNSPARRSKTDPQNES
jgi:hypothetical protein